MLKKAKELLRGEVFRMHVYGQVMSVTPIPGTKRVKVTLALENQGGRNQCGAPAMHRDKPSLEFTDDGHVIEFICSSSRNFAMTEWRADDGDDRDGVCPTGPAPADHRQH